MGKVEEHLAEAERHVIEAEERVRQQEFRIEELRRDRHNTRTAEELLETLRETLRLMYAGRDRLREALRVPNA